MTNFFPVRFQSKTVKCSDIIRSVFHVEPGQTLYSYVLGNAPRFSLLISSDRVLPHLYFLRSTIANYQGATADAMSIFKSEGIDVRAYDDISVGNLAMWNACLVFPEGSDFFRLRDKIIGQLQQKVGMVPPTDFFFVEFFRHLGSINERAREIIVSDDCNLRLDEETIKEMGISWDTTEPSAAVATPFELMPGFLFSFVPPNAELVSCELMIDDRIGSIGDLTRLVSNNVDLVASTGMTVAFGKNALWRFYGVVTGNVKDLEKDLAATKPAPNVKIKKVDPSKL